MNGAIRLLSETGPHKPFVCDLNPAAATYLHIWYIISPDTTHQSIK